MGSGPAGAMAGGLRPRGCRLPGMARRGCLAGGRRTAARPGARTGRRRQTKARRQAETRAPEQLSGQFLGVLYREYRWPLTRAKLACDELRDYLGRREQGYLGAWGGVGDPRPARDVARQAGTPD